jgi:hypothetical protein
VFGPVGTLQNVAVISSMQKVPVVGADEVAAWLFWVADSCWPPGALTCSWPLLVVTTCAAAGDAAKRSVAAIHTACRVRAGCFIGVIMRVISISYQVMPYACLPHDQQSVNWRSYQNDGNRATGFVRRYRRGGPLKGQGRNRDKLSGACLLDADFGGEGRRQVSRLPLT